MIGHLYTLLLVSASVVEPPAPPPPPEGAAPGFVYGSGKAMTAEQQNLNTIHTVIAMVVAGVLE